MLYISIANGISPNWVMGMGHSFLETFNLCKKVKAPKHYGDRAELDIMGQRWGPLLYDMWQTASSCFIPNWGRELEKGHR